MPTRGTCFAGRGRCAGSEVKRRGASSGFRPGRVFGPILQIGVEPSGSPASGLRLGGTPGPDRRRGNGRRGRCRSWAAHFRSDGGQDFLVRPFGDWPVTTKCCTKRPKRQSNRFGEKLFDRFATCLPTPGGIRARLVPDCWRGTIQLAKWGQGSRRHEHGRRCELRQRIGRGDEPRRPGVHPFRGSMAKRPATADRGLAGHQHGRGGAGRAAARAVDGRDTMARAKRPAARGAEIPRPIPSTGRRRCDHGRLRPGRHGDRGLDPSEYWFARRSRPHRTLSHREAAGPGGLWARLFGA
jgi:hypothetical protein